MEKNAFAYALEYEWHDVARVLAPAVPDAEAYLKERETARRGEDAALGEDSASFVAVRVPAPKSMADIPPARKSGRAAAVSFY
jgi:hypothetical protein